MRDLEPGDFDEIIRQAHAMRAEAVAQFARSVVRFFQRRKPVARPLLG